MKNIIFIIGIIIVILILPTVFADEQEWVDPQEKVLRLGEFLIRDNFSIEATSFYDNSVLITVYRREANNIDGNNTYKTTIDNNIMRIGDSWNVSDNIKKDNIVNITIEDLREDRGNISAYEGLNVIVDQWVKINTRMAGKPLPIVSIVPEERHVENRTIVNRIFTPGSEMTINFTIENIGKAKLKELKLKINTSLPILFSDKLDHELTTLDAGNTTTVSIRFRAPSIQGIERKNISIDAEATGVDVFGRKYYDNDSTYVIIKPFVEKLVEIKKFIPERIYMGDTVYISLNIKNNFYSKVNMSVTDNIPAGFEILNGNGTWNIDLESNKEKDILYKIRPKKPGIYSSGYACADIENIGIECGEPKNKLIISGPYIELIKSIYQLDNKSMVKILAQNKGDRTAIVKLFDYIPGNNSIGYNNSDNINNTYNKTVFKTMIIRPQNFVSFDYILDLDNVNIENNFTLPPAEAIVYDQFLYLEDRYTQKVVSNSLVIRK